MKGKSQPRNPPAQKIVNELWQALGATSNPEAIEHAREIIEAAKSEPIILTLVLHRTTGALSVRHNVRTEWGETAIKQLRDALRQIDESLVVNLAQLAEQRGKQTQQATNADAPKT